MGVWHTGDNEYLRTNIHQVSSNPPIREYPCKYCKRVFLSKEELFTHRFECHPSHRPMLFLNGQELGTSRVIITRSLSAEDVSLRMCDHAILNNEMIDVKSVPYQLAKTNSDVCRLMLINNNVQAEFTLDFQIAKFEDLIGIEKQFVRSVSISGLDTRAVEEFISASAVYNSAIGYCDGICAYLYGVLAKERVPDSTLPYDEYTDKYNKSVEKLSGYERPLARTICSLIEFHYNHFRDAMHLAKDVRVGRAAARFASLLGGSGTSTEIWKNYPITSNILDEAVTDWETEQIVRWTISRFEDLPKYKSEITSLLDRIETRYDRVKLHILLAEIYDFTGDYNEALSHAKELRNLPGLESWAVSKIQKCS